ncbi:MAG: T9SS type A sorting domain-containing protein [Gracilimonas sp.]
MLLVALSSIGFAQAPTTNADDPESRDAADVISIFSDAYDDITIDTFSAEFDDSSIEEIEVNGNAIKKIDFTNFIAIEFLNDRQDASEMTHFHMDFWTAETDLDGKVFNSKFSHWGGTDGEVSALELNINTATNPAIESRTWVSIDVPFSQFENTPDARDDLAQFLITSNLDIVYVDNIYLYKETVTSIDDDNELPGNFRLEQNYPNPFNPTTNISFIMPKASEVNLEVFNIMGQKVATLVDGFRNQGSHITTFDASNLASGMYTYRLTAGSSVQVRKMMLIK